MPPPHELLMALTRLQTGTGLPQLIREHGPVVAEAAATVHRVVETDNLTAESDEDAVTACLMGMSGRVSRRRALAHLRKNGVMRPDAPFHKMMIPGSAPTVRGVMRVAAARNGRSLDDIKGGSSRAEAVMARFEAAWIAFRAFGYPITLTAEAMSRNHTTLLSGINKIDILIKRSPLRLDGLLEAADDADDDAAKRHADLIRGVGTDQ